MKNDRRQDSHKKADEDIIVSLSGGPKRAYMSGSSTETTNKDKDKSSVLASASQAEAFDRER